MGFAPIATERLLIRAPVEADLDALHARRNHPSVAEHQSWVPPVERDETRRLLSSAVDLGGPTDDRWWMATVVERNTDAVIADLAIKLAWGGRAAEIGYSFTPDRWGHGFAVEAVQALVDHLFDHAGVTRVHAMLVPDNVASAMVLERTGFVFEGHTRNSYWVDDVNSDDWIYGQTPEDHAAWTNRRRTAPDHVGLVAIDHTNEADVYRLETHRSQRRFVAPMARSFANALFPEHYRGEPSIPWHRAVVADGEIVGFVMLALPTPAQPDPYLWRLLVDRLHQRRGIGRRVLDLIVEQARADGATAMEVSWSPGRGSPEPLYLGYGFVPTGEIEDDEIVARLELG